MKPVIAWFARNHVAANLLMLFVILAGTVTGWNSKVEVMPESTLDRISISVVYPGAAPEEVEEGIIRRIEENVAGLAGVKRIDANAVEGLGTVTVEVMPGWDLKQLLDDVKGEVDRITTFPEEAEQPVIREVTRRIQVINVAVYGEASEWTLKHLAEQIKDDLTNLPGITLAELFGVRSGEVHLEISEATLRRYGLTLGQVADQVRRGSFDLPAGTIRAEDGEILVRTKGRRYHAEDYRDLAVITRTDGSTVTLGQIAELSDGFEDVDKLALFQGRPAAVIQVYRVADQNALTVAATVKQHIERIRPGLPEGIRISTYQDNSEILRSRIRLLLSNMAMGLVLVSLMLGLFLSVRLAFWVTMGIPTAFLTGLWLLPRFDVSINMISLFAFIMVLGMVVDDAIVIGESVFKYRERGVEREAAAVDGAIDVGLPVIFSVLTTVAAFWPLMQGTGIIGKVMRTIPIVVILVLLGSLVEALLILPAHLARSRNNGLTEPRKPRRVSLSNRLLNRLIAGPYRRSLEFCLRWRYATAAAGLALLLLTLGLWFGGRIQFTFFPKVESDVLICSLTMPAGTPVERTRDLVRRIDQAAHRALAEADREQPAGTPPLMQYSVALIGAQAITGHGAGSGDQDSANRAQLLIQLLGGEQRKVSAAVLATRWREAVGAVADAETLTFQSDIFTAGNAVEVHLSLDDQAELIRAVEALKAELNRTPGVLDVGDGFLPGKDEYRLRLKPTARSLGLTLNDLALQVRHAFYGAEALRLQRDRDEVKVLVRYPEAERKSLATIRDMRIRTVEGSEVPFAEVAEVEVGAGYAAIDRAQRRRVVAVTADVDETAANANEVRRDLTDRYLPLLQQNHPGLRFTIEGEGKEQAESLADVVRGFVIALFAIYALLAVPFKSFTQPLIVMTAIPFGIIGAVFGHLLMGMNLSILSMFGIVGLAGVVVNDSLVLVDAANRLRRSGSTVRDAVVEAGALRFRAIILTSITTFGGLTPMILEKSLQARFLIPMAVSLGFGVMFATGITLILIPCGYLMLEDLHRAWAWLRQSRIFHGAIPPP